MKQIINQGISANYTIFDHLAKRKSKIKAFEKSAPLSPHETQYFLSVTAINSKEHAPPIEKRDA